MTRDRYTVTGSFFESVPSSWRPRIRWWGALSVSLLLTLSAVVTTASVAGAYWSSKGTAAGQARTSTLAPPTGLIAEASDFDSVDVDWTAPTGLLPTGYYVTRSSGGATVAACGSSPTALVTAVSCTDNTLSPGNYTYTVVAVVGPWTRASAPSAVVTIVAQKHLAITRQPQPNVPSNGSLGQVVVRLRDANNNNLQIKNVLVSVAINPATPSLQGASPLRTSNTGSATFNSLNVTEPGTYTLTISAPGYSSETSNPFTVGGFARVQAQSGAGQSTEVGTPFDRPVAFRVSDAQGIPIAGAPVSFSTRTGADGASGIVTGPSTVTTGPDGIAQTTVQAGAREGKFTVEATTRGDNRPVTASSVLTNTEPDPTSTSPPDTAPTTPGTPAPTTTNVEPTPTGTTAPATSAPVAPTSPTAAPTAPSTTAPTTAPASTSPPAVTVPAPTSTSASPRTMTGPARPTSDPTSTTTSQAPVSTEP